MLKNYKENKVMERKERASWRGTCLMLALEGKHSSIQVRRELYIRTRATFRSIDQGNLSAIP